jgi:hypothetical protein
MKSLVERSDILRFQGSVNTRNVMYLLDYLALEFGPQLTSNIHLVTLDESVGPSSDALTFAQII